MPISAQLQYQNETEKCQSNRHKNFSTKTERAHNDCSNPSVSCRELWQSDVSDVLCKISILDLTS
jgi:hypothetical protein